MPLTTLYAYFKDFGSNFTRVLRQMDTDELKAQLMSWKILHDEITFKMMSNERPRGVACSQPLIQFPLLSFEVCFFLPVRINDRTQVS